jgi:hydroxymethylpyrimidine/phosphomethylpyrimidine kinase
MESVDQGVSAPLLVSIGTTHPWNIAGVGLDARVAAEYHLPHAMAVVAVSAQDAGGLRALYTLPPEIVRAQLDVLPRADAYRVGALVSSENVRIVGEYLRARADTAPVIVDPVVRVTLGGVLQTDPEFMRTLRTELLTLPVIVTPNLDEAEDLTGMRAGSVPEMLSAARRLVALGARAALVKGGHAAGDPVDILATNDGTSETFGGVRLRGSMRGSGCTLAAALAAELAQGRELHAAVAAARQYVRAKIGAETFRGGLQVAF